MPELREVFEMTTEQMEPDVNAWQKQQRRQGKASRNKRFGAFAVAAAIVLAVTALVITTRPEGTTTIPASPATTETVAPAPTAGTLTFDGSTCSLETTADPIDPGVVVFDAVNTSAQQVMLDPYELVNGYTFDEFERAIGRMARRQERGLEGSFPEADPAAGPGQEVAYLGSEVIPANGSGQVVTSTTSGTYAIVCLKPYAGLGLRPGAIAGPFAVG
jgi:hypothetical protein